MNSIKNFMEIFDRKRRTQSWQEITSLIKECDQYFKNIPASERGVVLSIFLDERKGLLAFLTDGLERAVIDKDSEGAMIRTFHLLVPIMEQFADNYEPYIKPTMSVLRLALVIKSSMYLKEAAAETFIKFIQVFQLLDLDFDSTVNEWLKKLHLFSISERRLLLSVISVVSWHFPQTAAFGRRAKIILRQLMADYAQTCQGTKKSVQSLPVYVETLKNLLRNFPPTVDDTGAIAPESLYANLKDLCNSKESRKNKKLMLAVINLLSEHLSLFDEWVYEDYEFWHMSLKSLVKEKTYEDCAIKALRNYYRTMGTVLGRKESPGAKKIFLNLRDSFTKSLADEGISSTELRLTVYGFGRMMEACKNYLSAEGIKEMFSSIAHRTIPLYSGLSEDKDVTRLEEIADYQETLSRIIRYSEDVSSDEMRALTTLCSLMMKRFPEMTIADQRYATLSLGRTILNVRHTTKEILHRDFIGNIVYEGIVWSCSHALAIDADEPIEQPPITYKDYAKLWRDLANPENYSIASEKSETRGAALQTVVDEIVATCGKIINALNLNVAAAAAAAAASSNQHRRVFYDEKLSRIPENESDFRIFLNLVDLYVEILPSIEYFLWEKKADEFLGEMMRKSYEYPMISGFYKLARVTLVSSGMFSGGANRKDGRRRRDKSYESIVRYLWKTMDSLGGYNRELQISCLRLVLDIPDAFVARIVDRAVPSFRICLRLGRTDYEMATSAMAALERWRECLNGQFPKKFISRIVPCLGMFLASSGRYSEDADDDETLHHGFQKRILLFFGSLEEQVMSEYVHGDSLKTGARWRKKDPLKYPLAVTAEASLEIDLEATLPRITELAQRSGDRGTRIAACEVLHTMVGYVLGKTVDYLARDKDRFSSLYGTLCPTLLRLACDSDRVIRQLYGPLTMQLTHWLSGRAMVDSVATIHLVEALFEGLCDEADSSLRELSGIYLAEFVDWSMKQSSDAILARSPVNVDLIVRRIADFALDPSPNRRIAAAIAFNDLYPIIRECEETVNAYWLVLLESFVESLEGCFDARIEDSLRHVERVLVEKTRIFAEANPRRIRPRGFAGVTNVDALEWILERCGSLDRNCRKKCMEIFVSLSRAIYGGDYWKIGISEYSKNHGIGGLNEILFGNAADGISASREAWSMLERSLDLYVWLIRRDLIEPPPPPPPPPPPDILFTNLNPDRMKIFRLASDFVDECLATVATADDSIIVENERASDDDLEESVESRSQRCATILVLFDFFVAIIENVVATTNAEYIPEDEAAAFDDKFFRLVSVCSLEPHKLGFVDSRDWRLVAKLVERLLKKSMEIFGPDRRGRMADALADRIDIIASKLFNLDERIESGIWPGERSLRGLILLRKCGALKMCRNCDDEITAEGAKKIEEIFRVSTRQQWGEEESACLGPTSPMKIYLERLVELLLIDYDLDTIKALVKIMTNETEVVAPPPPPPSDLTVTTTTRGEYFFGLFETVLIRGLTSNVRHTLNLLEESINARPEAVLRIIQAIASYLRRANNNNQRGEIVQDFTEAILSKFDALERSINNFEHRRDALLNIYAIAVRLRRKKLLERECDLYRWIIRELVSSDNYNYKIRLLRDFLICLTDETLDQSPELAAILGNLRNERKIGNADGGGGEEESDERRASTETIDYFKNLVELLPITKSTVVLDAAMNYSCRVGEILREDDIGRYIELYYDVLGASNALKSLEITYKRLMYIRTNDTNERFDVLRYFLLPALNHCNPETMDNFFRGRANELYAIAIEEPTSDIDDRRQLLVSKIASYALMESMFANLSRDRIDSFDNDANSENNKVKFSRKIFQCTLAVRQFRAIRGDDREMLRLLHCSAYKCCIAIVGTTKNERFYLAVFGENREKNQLIWEKIIDLERKYNLRQTSEEYRREGEKFVNIRRSDNGSDNIDDNYSYVKSYDLASSSLNDNIRAYDFNAANLMGLTKGRGEDERKETKMTVRLERDDLNEHECMPIICGILKLMEESESAASRRMPEQIILPKWMSHFRAGMSSKYGNVRLFLLKIVLNSRASFTRYAKYFIEPVTNAIYRCLEEYQCFNNVVTDALYLLMEWAKTSIPHTEGEIDLARRMFSTLVDKSTSSAPTSHILEYNFSIVEAMVVRWHECLVVPEALVDDRLSSRDHRDDRLLVKLVLVFLTNEMPEKIVQREDAWEYVMGRIADWKIEEDTVLRSYRAAGLMLKHSTGRGGVDYDRRKSRLVETATGAFRDMRIPSLRDPGRLVKCIHSLCEACPELVADFFNIVSSVQLKVEPANVARCLEIFSMMLPNMPRDEIVKELSYARFDDLLGNKVASCEKICLWIVQQLTDKLEARHLSRLVKLVAPYADHDNLAYRRSCFHFFLQLHEKYSSRDNVETIEIIEASERILLSGLLDPDQDLQRMLLNFWSNARNAAGDKCSERLFHILDTYNCGVERNFLEIVALLLLDLTTKSVNCEKKLFKALDDCAYTDHDISINNESRLPLFAPSLISLASRFDWSLNGGDGRKNHFVPSRVGAATASRNAQTFAVPDTPESFKRNDEASRRFLADQRRSNVTIDAIERREREKFFRDEYGGESLARQRGKVKLYRKYRIGHFPDIEINHCMISGTMRQLVKRDSRICKKVLVQLVGSLMDSAIDEREIRDYRMKLSSKLTRILADGRENKDMVAAVLEILFNVEGLESPPWPIIARTSDNYRLYVEGAILMERSLMSDQARNWEPPAKKPRIAPCTDICEDKARWIELARLYESINDLDVSLGILKSNASTEESRLASVARAADDWPTAEEYYRKALETETDDGTKRHCLRGTLECLARLGKWKKLEKDIDRKIGGNYENLLSDDWKESGWMTPWIFRAHTRTILECRGGNEKFLTAMKSFLNDATSYGRLKERYGQQTAIILCKEKPRVARDFLNGSLEIIRREWSRANPLAVSLRWRAVLELGGIYDIDSYLGAIDNPDIAVTCRESLKRWKNSFPSVGDDLLAWDTRASYRWYFLDNLISAVRRNESQESQESQENHRILVSSVRSLKTRQMLRIVDCSLNEKNQRLTKKYLLRIEAELDDCEQELVDEFELYAIELKYLKARTADDYSAAASLEHYSSVWQQCQKIIRSDASSSKARIAVGKTISRVSESLAKLAEREPNFLNNLATRCSSILEDVSRERIDFESGVDSLYRYGLTSLKKCCELAPEMADCHFRLAKYCYERISSSSSGNWERELSRDFVRSTLRAMSHGSEEATYYFPCLLRENILSCDESGETLIRESANVETWRFLAWQTQLLSHLGTRTAWTVRPIVRRMMDTYPNAMVYSVRLALDTSLERREDPALDEMKNFLADKRDFNEFMDAMEYVVSPELHIRYYLDEFLNTFPTTGSNKDQAMEKLMKKLYPADRKDGRRRRFSLQGDAYKEIVAPYETEIRGMKESPPIEADIERRFNHLSKRFNESTKNLVDKNRLRYYSPWLEEYFGRDIQVPGQYSVNEKPWPRYHAKIVKIESRIKVMRSMRKPIRITLLATDGKTYRFLVKFGEDLRRDQRIEEIFGIMNDKLKSDRGCRRRRLSIDTYQIFPLSGSLGLVQWIEGTRTLGEYINLSMDDDEKMGEKYVEREYDEWIGKAAPGQSSSIRYKEALLRYKAEEVEAKMKEFTSRTKVDALRQTFVRLSTCVSSFATMRRNFTSTYATMCAAQWILGIGDRHAANTLIKVESGGCIGIDFGSAFGAGLDQSVPELAPFRLTPQIRRLLEPFGEYDSMGPSMISALRAFNESKGSPLLACLDVVAHERHSNKFSQKTDDSLSDVPWLSEAKVRIVRKKLDGAKPSAVTLEQLAEHHFDARYFPRYVAIVGGSDSDPTCKRCSFAENNLSAEQQVECLIEQATDLNVLGRTYVGWAPWL